MLKRYLRFFAFAILAIFSLVFVSCGDDDDNSDATQNGTQFEIDGKSYKLSSNQVGVIWIEPPFGSTIQFSTGKHDMFDSGEIYTFGFPAWDGKDYCEPKVGMDLTKLEMKLNGEVINSFTLTDDDDIECDYVSGSLVITAVDKSKETMTLKFTKLKMSNGHISHTFNGTIKLPFSIL